MLCWGTLLPPGLCFMLVVLVVIVMIAAADTFGLLVMTGENAIFGSVKLPHPTPLDPKPYALNSP